MFSKGNQDADIPLTNLSNEPDKSGYIDEDLSLMRQSEAAKQVKKTKV